MSPAETHNSFVRFIVRRPWVALLAGFVFVGALLPGAPNLKPNFTYRVWFEDDDELIQEFDAFERRFGNDEAAVVVVHSPSGIFDIESSLLIYELTEKLWRVRDVIRVDSLSTFNWVHSVDGDMEVEPILPEDDLAPYLYQPGEPGKPRADPTTLPDEERQRLNRVLKERREVALNHETLPNYLVSKNGKAAVLQASLKPAINGAPDYEPIVTELRRCLHELERTGDHEFYIIGGPVVSHSFKEAAQSDFTNLVPIVFGLAFAFLALFFRRISGVLLPIVVIVGTIVSAMSFGGWLGFNINNLTSIVPQILLAIAVADSVHILSSYYRALERGAARPDAAAFALQKNFLPTLLTSVSTAVGFFSFSTADVVPIAMLGVLAGSGTLFAWVLSYLWLGPLMVLSPVRTSESSGVALDDVSDRALRITARLQRYRRPILGLSVVLAVVCIGAASQTNVNSDPFEYFPPGSPLNEAREFLEENIGGPIPLEISVSANEEGGIKEPEFMKRVEAFQAWLDERDFITNTVSLVDILKSTNRSLHDEDPAMYVLPDSRRGIAEQYLLYTMSLPQGMDINDRVTVKEDALRISTSWTIRDSSRFIAEVDRVKTVAQEEFDLSITMTGKTQLWQRMNPKVVSSFATSITIALVLMTLLMIAVFRSAGLGLLAMIPNGLPLIVGSAFLVVIGKDLDIGTVLVFSVCLGIAVDDTVHFLANYSTQRRLGRSSSEAVAYIFTHTMPALVITTVVLVAAFGTFAFASFIPNRFFGILVAFVLSVALITDATLLPALLMKGEDAEHAKES